MPDTCHSLTHSLLAPLTNCRHKICAKSPHRHPNALPGMTDTLVKALYALHLTFCKSHMALLEMKYFFP